MADESAELPERAEALLTCFSTPERDWEADARAIEARLGGLARNSTEERWLEPPLAESSPPTSGAEVEAAPTPVASRPSASSPPGPAAPAGSSSLLALARSVKPKNVRPEATNIARESLSVAAQARAQTSVIAERVRSSRSASTPPPGKTEPALAPDQAEKVAAAAPALEPTPSVEPAPAKVARRVRTPRRPGSEPREEAGNRLGPWIAVGGLGVAVAAALAVFLRPDPAPAPDTEVVAAAPIVTPPPAPSMAVLPQATPKPPNAAAPAAPAPAAEVIPPPPPISDHVARLGQGPPRAAGGVAPAPRPAAKVAGHPAPERVVLEDTGAPASNPAASTAANPGLRPAAGTAVGGLPDRPATGAVQAAIGSVMGSARSCVAGATTPTPAQVVFGSDGTVRAITVSGPSAGTPAASCIEAALKRARVAPFASPTFSLMVWVRP
jgi:hypothetical protein